MLREPNLGSHLLNTFLQTLQLSFLHL